MDKDSQKQLLYEKLWYERKKLGTHIAVAIICLFSVIFLRSEELILTIVLASLASLLLVIHYNLDLTIRFIFISITMPIVEMICIFFGVWYYYSWTRSLLSVPLWLFPLWGIVFIIFKQSNLIVLYKWFDRVCQECGYLYLFRAKTDQDFFNFTCRECAILKERKDNNDR